MAEGLMTRMTTHVCDGCGIEYSFAFYPKDPKHRTGGMICGTWQKVTRFHEVWGIVPESVAKNDEP